MIFPKPCRGGVGLLDLAWIGQFTKIHLGQIVGARGAFHAALAGAILERFVGGWNQVRYRLAPGGLGIS